MKNGTRFPRDARVMFIGDSITRNGTFVAYIQEYYLTHFPNDRVKCYNAGVSGGCVWSSALRYLDADLALFEPTHAVVMLGMNDIWRGHYMDAAHHYTDIKTERGRLYFDGMATLAEKLYARGISVTFCTPTPFDDEMVCETPAGKNLGMALTGYGNYCVGLAEKYGADVVDFNGALTYFNREMQTKDPTFSLCGADRVHPTALGHVFMALTFLRAQGFTDLPEPNVENYEKGLLTLSLSPTNEKRLAAEDVVRKIRCGAYFCLGERWQAPFDERMAAVQAFYDENKDSETVNPYILQSSCNYLALAGEEEAYQRELLAVTDALYE